jgi:hypothetical protein
MKRVKCFGIDVETVIDTGAGISVISPKFCDKLPLKMGRWAGPKILIADGRHVSPTGSVELVLVVDGQRIRVQAAVFEINGFELLLGNDALRKLGTIKIDYAPAEPAEMSATNEFDVVEEEEASYQVIPNESRSIPALSMVTLAVESKGKAVVNEMLMI